MNKSYIYTFDNWIDDHSHIIYMILFLIGKAHHCNEYKTKTKTNGPNNSDTGKMQTTRTHTTCEMAIV